MVRLAEPEEHQFVPVTPPHWSFGNVSLYPPPAPSWSPKTPPPRHRVATEPQVSPLSPLWPIAPGRTSSSIPQPERIRPPITAPMTARTSGAAIVGCPTSSADGDASTLRPASARCGSEGISPAITFAEASKMPPPRTYSSVALPLGHGSAIVPEYLSRSPLAPSRQLVAEATRWKETYLKEREPLLTHPTVQGLQKVHDEWHRESASQKALLHVHLAAAVERLECLESNETRHLEHIKELEQRLQERRRELVDLKKKLEDSERDRAQLRTQLQEKRGAAARRPATVSLAEAPSWASSAGPMAVQRADGLTVRPGTSQGK